MPKVVPLDKFADELKELSSKSVKGFKRSVIDALYKNLADIVRNSPVDTGLYAQSWRVEETERNAMLGNIAPHAAIIEFGSRPYKPPLRPLLNWAKRVLMKEDYDDHVWALAKYTQKKIEENGQQPKHVLTKQIDRIIEDIRENMRKLKLV